MAWRHGTTTGYSGHRCTCDACREAWREYQRTYMRERYHGELRTVPTKEARVWIRRLLAHGMTLQAISRAAGVQHQLVRKIEAGKTRRARRTTVGKILAVTPDERPEGAMSPASEAQRIVEALRAAGVPAKTIAGALRVTAPARIKRQKHVHDRTRRRLVLAYRHLARQGVVRADLLEEVNA